MDFTTHLRTFTAVVRCGGFSEAARQLGVVPSLVAKRVAQLEEEIGARLFERTTRKVALTDAGETLYSRAATVVAEFEDLLSVVKRDDGKPEGHLKLMAPTTLTMEKLGPAFCDFLAMHPRITMEIVLVDRSTNPAEGGFDIAISGRAASYEGVVDVPLCPVRPLLCASPSFLASRPEPSHPRELAELDCLVFSATGTTWTFTSHRGTVPVDVKCRLLADDNRTLLHAAVQGLGLTLLPSYIAGPSIEAGDLQVVMPAFTPQENWFKAHVPKRKMASTRVKALLEFLKERLPVVLNAKADPASSLVKKATN